MNHLNESYHSANQALIGQVLSATLDEKPALIKACQCHWIDPHKLRMLLWKDIKDGQEIYILKIAEQKFVGEARADRRGETYWRFRSLYEGREAKPTDAPPAKPKKLPEIEINQPLSAASASTDRLAKFQERQAKAQLAPTKWVEGKAVLAQLAKDKEERQSQAQENASLEIKENANFNQPVNQHIRTQEAKS